jgi:simple sugar transport system substrate-binding protein
LEVKMRKVFLSIFLSAIGILIIYLVGCPAPNNKSYQGIRIVFFAGGFKDDPFTSLLYSGVRQAEKDFGCKVEFLYANWDIRKITDDFKDAIEKKPDGICILGHPGERILSPLVDEAISKGIIVTSLNISLPAVEEKYVDRGFGFVGQNAYNAGYNLAKMCVKRLSLKKSDKILVWGQLGSGTDRKYRTMGIIDYLKKNNYKFNYLDIVKAPDPKSIGIVAFESFLNYYKTNHDLNMLFIDAGIIPPLVPEFFKKYGIPPGKIRVAGFDLSEGSLRGIKEGYINIVNDQQIFLQGYFPVLQICLAKKYGFTGLHINTDSSFIDESNVNFFETFVKQKIR